MFADERVRAAVTRRLHEGLEFFFMVIIITLERNVSDFETMLPCHKNGHTKSIIGGDTTELLATVSASW